MHIALRMQRAGRDATADMEDLRRIALVVAPQAVPQVIASDPDDDHVPAARADLIASSDRRDLLPLGSYEGIPIITAREALQRLG